MSLLMRYHPDIYRIRQDRADTKIRKLRRKNKKINLQYSGIMCLFVDHKHLFFIFGFGKRRKSFHLLFNKMDRIE